MFARPGLCGMGIGRLGLVAASQPSLITQALAILAKYGAAANLYLPGVGAINGITAGNWLDSIGTTAAAVDSTVGLALDSMGVLGAELVTNGDFSAGTAGWNAKSATISTVGGELSVLAASTAQPSAAQAISTVSGKTYKSSARLRADAANAVAKSARVRVAENASGGPIYSGPYEVTSNGVARELTAFFTAPIATVYVLLEVGSSSAYGNVGDKAYFDNISVREVPGAHLTQSTAANRPVLRRGLVNQATYSSDFSNATWQQYKASAVGSKIVANTENSYHAIQRNYTHTVGSIQTYAIEASTAEYENLRVTDGSSAAFYASLNTRTGVSSSSGGSRLVSVSSTLLPSGRAVIAITVTGIAATWQIGFIGYPASGATLTGWGVAYKGDGTSGINVHAQALFPGTVTASQILAAGGIPVTTTAPASSATGPFAWQWDGSDDRFASTLTPGNAGFFCAAANVTDSGVLRTLLGAGAGSDASSGVWLARAASNALTLQVGNGTTRNSVSAAYPVATNAVASAGWDASAMFVGINGTETSGAKSVDCTSSNTINLGVLTGTTNPMLGTISGGAIIMPTVLPTATERSILRQLIASLSGVTL